jgi:hypothetical protein
MKYQNLADAGRQLVAWLRSYLDHPNAIVLALPRGGVPVAHEVARACASRSTCSLSGCSACRFIPRWQWAPSPRAAFAY